MRYSDVRLKRIVGVLGSNVVGDVPSTQPMDCLRLKRTHDERVERLVFPRPFSDTFPSTVVFYGITVTTTVGRVRRGTDGTPESESLEPGDITRRPCFYRDLRGPPLPRRCLPYPVTEESPRVWTPGPEG